MQMLGLEPLLDEAKGSKILDVGTAEGLIAFELAKVGAKVHGIDSIAALIETANNLKGNLACTFEVADAVVYEPDQYDIILLLSILHKCRHPSAVCSRFAKAAKDLLVMRLPPELAPVIRNKRTRDIPHDMKVVMTWYGFELERVTRGSFAEWIGFFRKRKRV